MRPWRELYRFMRKLKSKKIRSLFSECSCVHACIVVNMSLLCVFTCLLGFIKLLNGIWPRPTKTGSRYPRRMKSECVCVCVCPLADIIIPLHFFVTCRELKMVLTAKTEVKQLSNVLTTYILVCGPD